MRIAITRIGKPGWCNNDFRFHPRWQTTSISSNQDFRKWNLFLFSVKLLKKELALASLYFSGLQIRLDDSWKFTCMGQLRFGIYYPWEDLKVFTTIQNIFKFSTNVTTKLSRALMKGFSCILFLFVQFHDYI